LLEVIMVLLLNDVHCRLGHLSIIGDRAAHIHIAAARELHAFWAREWSPSIIGPAKMASLVS